MTTAIAREDAKKGSEQHAVSVGEFAREYLARAKGSATAVRYHGIAVNDEEICRRILTDLPPHMHFIREGFVLRMDFPVVKLEHALVKVGSSRSDRMVRMEMPWQQASSLKTTRGGKSGGGRIQGAHGTGGRHGAGGRDSGGRSGGRKVGRRKHDGRGRHHSQCFEPPPPYF